MIRAMARSFKSPLCWPLQVLRKHGHRLSAIRAPNLDHLAVRLPRRRLVADPLAIARPFEEPPALGRQVIVVDGRRVDSLVAVFLKRFFRELLKVPDESGFPAVAGEQVQSHGLLAL